MSSIGNTFQQWAPLWIHSMALSKTLPSYSRELLLVFRRFSSDNPSGTLQVFCLKFLTQFFQEFFSKCLQKLFSFLREFHPRILQERLPEFQWKCSLEFIWEFVPEIPSDYCSRIPPGALPEVLEEIIRSQSSSGNLFLMFPEFHPQPLWIVVSKLLRESFQESKFLRKSAGNFFQSSFKKNRSGDPSGIPTCAALLKIVFGIPPGFVPKFVWQFLPKIFWKFIVKFHPQLFWKFLSKFLWESFLPELFRTIFSKL